MNKLVPVTAITVRFRLNGAERTVRTRADARLVDLLREEFALTATKAACRIGRCGSCLVLLNGSAVNACLLMAWQIEGADIVSPEALVALPEGRIVNEALVAEVAFQCGYCAPGFAVALTALFRAQPDADETAIRTALAGNICRCTGYSSIIRGAIAARQRLAAHRETCTSNKFIGSKRSTRDSHDHLYPTPTGHEHSCHRSGG
jgi:aerobic-type carbon monoxide dehydrogenase small subunit (CoxS/CutS family)